MNETRDHDLIDRVLTGGYPDAVTRDAGIRRRDWFAAYAKAIAERDLPDIAKFERAADLPRFLRMLAALNGQPVNATELGGRLQIDRKTAQRYLALAVQILSCGRFRQGRIILLNSLQRRPNYTLSILAWPRCLPA